MTTASAEPATTILLDLVARPQRGGEAAWARTALAIGTAHDDSTWLAAWALLLARLAGVDTVAVARLDARGADTPLAFSVDDAAPARALRAAPADPSLAPDSGWAAAGWSGARPAGERPLLVWQLEGAELVARYAAASFAEATVRDLAALLARVAGRLAASPDAPLGGIPLLTPEERDRLLVEWNRTDVNHRPGATVHGLFRERAAATPDAPAVVWDGGTLSYAELDRRSDALARRLVAAGVTSEEPVAVALERSAEAVVAVLAILKAGGAYLPLDLNHPAKRITFTLEDARARAVVTLAAHRAQLAALGATVVAVDEEAAAPAALPEGGGGRQLAYIMYTSGSTGTPKGVLIEHRSIIRLVCGDVGYVRLGPDTVMLHAAPLGFDASTLELWGPLLNGGRVVVYADRVPTGRGLERVIAAHGVTTAWLTAALFNAVVDEDPRQLGGLRQLLTGGEALSPSHVRRALAALSGTELINGYGPTECTTFTTTHAIPRDLPADAASIPIGRPIPDTRVYVLNQRHQPVPIGVAGELWVGGAGVARGYLRRPELDAERFAPDDFVPGGRLYRTGDLVRWRDDGAIEFVGRIDQQVKIRGFRIELGEIEAALAQRPGVRACAVVVHELPSGDGKRLVAYAVPEEGKHLDLANLRAALAHELPDFMVPSAFMELPALPVTENGKLDRRALPVPSSARPELAHPYRAPAGEIEAGVCRVFQDLLGIDRVGALDGFFELGGNSLLAMRAISKIREAGLPEVSAVQFFSAPTPAALAQAVARGAGEAAPARGPSRAPGVALEPVAIIGMAARLPGARDVEELWRNLVAGKESITRFAPGELDPSLPASLTGDPAYVAARGVLDGVELFDAGFFGVLPLEAQLMDPQHRLFLESCWEALEHAGHVPEHTRGRVGVFGGMYNATYFQRHVVHHPDLVARIGELQVMLDNEKDYLTSRVAHRLGLNGPAVTVQTACSTSLVAVCQAFDSLRRGECDMALAGGVAVTCPPRSGYLNEEGTMTSPDGQTRTFDAQAAGTSFSDGVALLVLRRLSDAVADGDRVYGVILGAAVNNDGAARASFTAPSPEGQGDVIAEALEVAGVSARSISFVETHGTATPIGDPIEVEGLTRAFRRSTSDRGFCVIGALKSNIGHTTIPSGAAGLIKTLLQLREKQLVPIVHYRSPSPQIDFSQTPFVPCARLMPWESDGAPRRAGVSSFGFGGTNAHVVVEEAPPPAATSPSPRPQQLLLLSAQSPAALAEAQRRLADHLAAQPSLPLADVAHTLRLGRRGFAQRSFVVAADGADAAAQLRGEGGARKLGDALPDVALLFPGQGSQYARMGQGLHESEPVFRAAFDECCAYLEPHLGGDPRARFFAGDADSLTQTGFTQPAVFTLEYALARLLLHFGVRPTAFIGHSVGEFVGAVLAGVMPLEHAAALVAHRGQLMQALPPGSMLSVRLPASELEPRLTGGVGLAAENGPAACVASGPTPAVERLLQELEAAGVPAKLLVTSHAFHSTMMDPVVEPFFERVAEVPLAPPKIPIVSTVTGTWLSAAEATSPRYWAEHLRRPVRFSPAVSFALADPRRVLVEVGPRATLSTLARQHVDPKRALPPAVSTMADAPEREAHALATALGKLWQLGVSLDWAAYVDAERRARVPLPTYPFQRHRYWVDAPPAGARPATAATPLAAAPAPVVAPPRPPELVRELIDQQLEIMAQQLAVLRAAGIRSPTTKGD